MWIETKDGILINLDHITMIKCDNGKIKAYQVHEPYPIELYEGPDAEAKLVSFARLFIKTSFNAK